ncbi:MAG: S-layer family protein, partial [Prochlorothrix sp.]|nr:S-layer family protein [Prochlorothrix sp.]
MGFGFWSVPLPIDRPQTPPHWVRCTCSIVGSTLAFLSLTAPPTPAQITADTTLSPQTNSSVTQSGSLWQITGGTPAGSSLFHSFSTFQLGLGETAYFDNGVSIANIFARITGANPATLNGTLRANGAANLYLLSPQGIEIGSGAQLQLGGSFIASTADRLLFQSGEFSATNPTAPPLLTINPPTGFQFDHLAAPIALQDSGHSLTTTSPILPLVLGSPPPSALQVSPAQSLVLLGGETSLNGAGLVAYGGQITIGAVGTGFVGFNQGTSPLGTPQFSLDYSQTSGFQDLTLRNQSLIEVSGLPPSFGGLAAGSVQLQGQNFSLREGSLVLSQNFGTTAAGGMQVTAAGDVWITGTDPRSGGILRSVLLSSAIFGDSGAIDLQAGRNLTINDGGAVASLNFSSAVGGDLNFRATNLFLDGVSQFTSQTNSSIASQTAGGTGPAGDVTVVVDRLQITGGAVFSSSSFQGGDGGNIDITARESVLIQGYDPVGLLSSTITPATFGRGNAGDVRLRTDRLELRDGGQISTATFAAGNAGNVDITATEILLVGNETGLRNQTVIASDGGILPPESQIRFGVTAPSGRSGDVRLRSQRLTLRDNAFLSANNLGSGAGGTLTVQTGTLLLDNQAQITAATLSGEGGNIDITANRALLMRQGSKITAAAGGTGNGGNIEITTPLLVGIPVENSDISANAVEGNGGNIQINAQAILGLKFRQQLTDRSDITASSQFGVSGTVNFNGPQTDVSSGLTQLPTQFADQSSQISNRCAATTENQFTSIGRGGLPENPRDPLQSASL